LPDVVPLEKPPSPLSNIVDETNINPLMIRNITNDSSIEQITSNLLGTINPPSSAPALPEIDQIPSKLPDVISSAPLDVPLSAPLSSNLQETKIELPSNTIEQISTILPSALPLVPPNDIKESNGSSNSESALPNRENIPTSLVEENPMVTDPKSVKPPRSPVSSSESDLENEDNTYPKFKAPRLPMALNTPKYSEQELFLMELYDKLTVGQRVYYVISQSNPVITDTNDQASDASNLHDEEVSDNERDFSDDEKEAQFFKTTRRRGKKRNFTHKNKRDPKKKENCKQRWTKSFK